MFSIKQLLYVFTSVNKTCVYRQVPLSVLYKSVLPRATYCDSRPLFCSSIAFLMMSISVSTQRLTGNQSVTNGFQFRSSASADDVSRAADRIASGTAWPQRLPWFRAKWSSDVGRDILSLHIDREHSHQIDSVAECISYRTICDKKSHLLFTAHSVDKMSICKWSQCDIHFPRHNHYDMWVTDCKSIIITD